MSPFLNNLEDKLATMEQKTQALPGELDSVVARLDRSKLSRLSFQLNQDFNKLLDRLSTPQRNMVPVVPYIFMPEGLNGPLFRRITEEDLARWRDAHKSEIRAVVGKEGVGVIAVSELAKEYQTTVSQVILAAQQQGYTVLGWDEYQNLLDEISSLIGEDEKSLPETTVMGIPVITTDSPNR